MAAFSFNPLQARRLVRAAHRSLNLQTSGGRNLDGLSCNLLGELSGRRNDESTDIGRKGAGGLLIIPIKGAAPLGVAVHLTARIPNVLLNYRIAEDVVHGRDKEGERFTGAGLRLGQTRTVSKYSLVHKMRIHVHVIASEHLVNRLTLHVGHGLQTHPARLGDVPDDVRVNETLGLQVCKLGDQF